MATAAPPRGGRRQAIALVPVLLCALGLVYGAALHVQAGAHHRPPSVIATSAFNEAHGVLARADQDAVPVSAPALRTPRTSRVAASHGPVTAATPALGTPRTRGPPAGVS